MTRRLTLTSKESITGLVHELLPYCVAEDRRALIFGEFAHFGTDL